ncbi:MAG TPA: hypothetical protein VK735_15445 [Pseudonocardia sp.]|uniref:VG15 protein n=1 Tax=Pseudonocardia sp. TaxID=60912 RepID=UPI002C2C72CF|nr:hypothetical protein [Pseudonocardia sp.]HTF48839.1 hypothetical protein [Pseudonocardia sp.]
MSRQGNRLAEEHREAQVALRAGFLAQFLPTLQLLSWARIDDSYPSWIRAVMGILRPFRQASADLAVDYYDRIRLVEAPSAPPPPRIEFRNTPETLPGPVRLDTGRNARVAGHLDTASRQVSRDAGRARSRWDDVAHFGEFKPAVLDWGDADDRAERSLLVTGPAALKKAARNGLDERRAMRNAVVQTSGAATRHVLNGGRDATMELIDTDDVAQGWIRMLGPNPCSFCAMLASRGPVFSESSIAQADSSFDGTGTIKVHDHCACYPKAVFESNPEWPGNNRAYQTMWNDNIKGRYSGKDARNAWRRLWEAQQREAQRAAEQIA